MERNPALYSLTFDQHHTRGPLRGVVTTGTLTLTSESAVDRWARAMAKYADRNGYAVANVRCERTSVAEYRRRFG